MLNCGDPYHRVCSVDGKSGELAAAIVHHIDIIGATRSGKTNYILSQLEGAFCFIDKHGDAARQIADSMPCIYWRPADLSHCIGLNPLQNVPPDQRYLVTAQIAAIFSDIWKLGWETPRLLYYLRASIRLALDTPGTTLLDIRPILTDDTYRARLVRKCTDKETVQTWVEFNAKKENQQAIEIGSLQNKVAALADPLPLRYVLGQPTSTIDFAKILNDGSPLVVDLSDIGDEPAAILGAVIINAFRQAADTTRNKNPYRLVIDECQNFGTHVLDTILSESGKRELWLTLAHQFVSQLDERLWHSILANCSTLVSFRVGANDAPLVGKALDWTAQDLQNQGRGVARFVTLVNGKPSQATLLKTEKVNLATGHLTKNIRNTRANFSRPRALVEHPRSRTRSGRQGAPHPAQWKRSAWGLGER